MSTDANSTLLPQTKMFGESVGQPSLLDDVLLQTVRKSIPIDQLIQETEEHNPVIVRHGGYTFMAYCEVPLDFRTYTNTYFYECWPVKHLDYSWFKFDGCIIEGGDLEALMILIHLKAGLAI